MKRTVLLISAFGMLSVAANAQVGGLTGIRLKAGYGWSGAVRDINGNSRHLQGPELGLDFPLMNPPLVSVSFTGDVLLGGQLARGGDLDGTVYRFLLSGRAAIPGSRFSVFAGAGYATAQGRGGSFGSVSGFVTQIGVAIPLTNGLPLVSPSLEIAGNMASRSALSGFSVSVGIKF